MKMSEQYIVRRIAGQPMLIPVGQKVVEDKEILNLSEPAFFLLKEIEKGTELNKIIDMYMIQIGRSEDEREETSQNINGFISKMIRDEVIVK